MMERNWPAVARGDTEAPPAMREWALDVTIALATWFERMKPGGLHGIMVNTANIDAEHSLLRRAGLEIGEIKEAPWGRYAMFNDPDGNGWVLRQPLRTDSDR